MFKQWKSLIATIQKYWNNYGGFKATLTSPYIHISFVMVLLAIPLWFDSGNKWWDSSLSIVPSMLGFTLGGFGIFLGYGNDKFRKIMAIQENNQSPYMEVVSSFLHFIIVQSTSIMLAILVKGLYEFEKFLKANFPECHNQIFVSYHHGNDIYSLIIHSLSFIGFFVFIYGIMLSFATGIALYKLASAYSFFETREFFNDESTK